MSIRCFLLTPTDTVRRSYRRYSSGSHSKCPLPFGYHNARAPLDEVAAIWRQDADGRLLQNCYAASDFPQEAFPPACGCGYAFTDTDERQIVVELLYKRGDTGAITTLREAPPGAIWDAVWMPECYRGPDDRCLVAILPNGNEWMIDGRASNCDSPCANCGKPYHSCKGAKPCVGYKDARPHKCWVRHGEPPNLTVDKAGTTCGAGAGSIQSGDYHGFLRAGVFEP